MTTPSWVLPTKPARPSSSGQPVHEGPESDALHHAPHQQPAPCDRRGRHAAPSGTGCTCGRSHQRRPVPPGAVADSEDPLQQHVGALTGAGAGTHDLHPGVHLPHVLREGPLVEPGRLGEVRLGEHDQMRGPEGRRVLQRLVLALGDRHEDDPQLLAEVVGGRADEVADVLHEQQRRAGRQPARQVAADLVRFQVAQPAGEELLHRGARPGQAPGVVLGRQVRGERRHGEPAVDGQAQHQPQQLRPCRCRGWTAGSPR